MALVVSLAVTGGGVLAIRHMQHGQERRLLEERTSEVGLILTQAVTAIPDRLKAQAAVLKVTQQAADAYERTAAVDVANSRGRTAFAWLRPSGSGSFVVLASSGKGFRRGEVISDRRAQTLRAALGTDQLVPGQVQGPARLLGFALGPPAAPQGTVIYQENQLGPTVSPPRQAATDPFSDLDLVLYGTPTVDRAQVLVGTSAGDLHGAVVRRPLPVGNADWLLVVKAKRPLIGDVAAAAPWFLLLAGLIASALIATVVETSRRRRDAALALLELERSSAESFQRGLLPRLPRVVGLDLAARYQASGESQQVGGDWYDVFPLPDGRTGLVIGDVMGHDLVAASGMAQVRAALRAYALDGEDPCVVLDELDRFVTTLEVAELATVFYGVLDQPAVDGSRGLRWSSAGHPAPVVRRPDGQVSTLAGGESLLIGTPLVVAREGASTRLEVGTALVLFTDGLVEVPGGSMDDGLASLAARVEAFPRAGADELCEHVLAGVPGATGRDDVAVLVVCLSSVPKALDELAVEPVRPAAR